MNLNSLIARRADPGVVRDALMSHFEGVEVVEANRAGWYDQLCHDGERVRLVVRFVWSTAQGGWTYHVMPVRHRPRRAWTPGVTYHRDGSYSVAE